MTAPFWRGSVILLLCMTAASGAISSKADADAWQRKGYGLFSRGEFKQAAHAFRNGLTEFPDSAVLHYWLGKSYARLVELSTFSAARNARKAAGNLAQAVTLDPHNQDYVVELFNLYVDFPEFFEHGLDRAADLIERVGSEPAREEMTMRLDMSRHDRSGPEGRVLTATLWTVSGLGYLVPLP
jgi:tetratricopeptide (TPR) repeat protein